MECFTPHQHELKYVIYLDLSKPANGKISLQAHFFSHTTPAWLIYTSEMR